MGKQCKRCSKTKDTSKFCKRSGAKDGLQPWCKKCQREYRENYRLSDAGKSKENKYRQSKKGKAAHRKADLRYRDDNPDRYKANNIVNHAIRDGRLHKNPCRCGETKVQGHHEDYSKPLDVEWLCIECHEKRKV